MKNRFFVLLLALVLLAACTIPPAPGTSAPEPPPSSPAPAPESSSQSTASEPGPEPEPAPALKVPEDYAPEELDFIQMYCRNYHLPPENFWGDPYTQENIGLIYQVVASWLALPPEQLARKSRETAAFSNDGTKAVYHLIDDQVDYFSSYFIWSDHLTGENRLLGIFWKSAKNPADDALLFYDRGAMRGFSLRTGEELEGYGPPFDFGREAAGGRERELFGITWDQGTGCTVAAYLDRTQPEEDGRIFPIRVAVFDRAGALVRDIPTWLRTYDSYKNFPTYAEVISVSPSGTLRLGAYQNEGILHIDCRNGPVPLEEPEVLALWDTLEGEWAVPTRQEYGEKEKRAAFFLREGRPVLVMDGQEYAAAAVTRRSEITWEITARGTGGEKRVYVDTDIPGDYTILVMEEGEWDYSSCVYEGEPQP